MKFRSIILLPIILILGGLLLSAQNTKRYFVMKKPKKYVRPIESVDYSKSDESSSFLWVVWADRERLQTDYGHNLIFKNRYYVLNEDARRIQLASFDPDIVDQVTGEFMQAPEILGWIDKREMLLWGEGLSSVAQRFRIKGMTVRQPEMLRSENLANINNIISFYNSPYEGTPNDEGSPIFRIFYLYKKEGNRYLLGTKNNINQGANNNIYGWVNSDEIVLWRQRQALEPNQLRRAVNERKENDIPTAGFRNFNGAKQYYQGGNYQDAIWKSDPFSTNLDPYWKRFPVFETFDLNGNPELEDQSQTVIVKTGIIRSILDEDSPEDRDYLNELEKRFEVTSKRAENINIVFVVDATRSMSPYFQSIREAIEKTTGSRLNSSNRFKFGAVAYRDIGDKRGLTEVMELTNNRRTIKNFFDLLQEGENPTPSEAVYWGLYTALTQILIGKQLETNIIILIGDAGDRKGIGRKTKEDVRPGLIDYKCSFLAIQAHNGLHSTYRDFAYDMRQLILEMSLGIALAWKNSFPLTSREDYVLPKWLKQEGDFTLFRLESNTSSVEGSIQYAKRNDSITPTAMEEYIEKLIHNVDATNDTLITKFARVRENPSNDGFDPSVWRLLQNAGLTDEDILFLRQERLEFMLSAFVPIISNQLRDPMYNYVLLLDQGELDALMEDLHKLAFFSGTESERRTKLENTWKEVLTQNYGNENRQEVVNKNLADLMQLVTGLPSQSDFLRNYTLKDLGNKAVIQDFQLDEIIDEIRNKYNDLRNINGNGAKIFLSHGQPYYWVPQKYLP